MKALLQRVSSANVAVDERVVGEISRGLPVFLCAVKGEANEDLNYLARKTPQLSIFEDDQGRRIRSVMDIQGGSLVVSPFTLAASTRKGNRPSFDAAEAPERAKAMYDSFVQRLREGAGVVQTGEFAAMMDVSLVNDGP
jgi:D-tyrosyl-tRNA(Tyr) deacylase